jgi:hypothetical protein
MSYDDKIREVIELNGWCAVPVAASIDPPRPGYTYSVGFESEFGRPEVVIFGVQPAQARGLLDMMVEYLEGGGEFPYGQFVGFLDHDLPAALLPVDLDDYVDLFPTATAIFGAHPFRVSQLVYPDHHGLMPWDAECEPQIRAVQPLIGAYGD